VTLRKLEGDVIVEVRGTSVELTSLDRVYWPDDGLTKLDLLRYYARVGPRMMPFLENRPAILQRFPRGIGHPKFFQHDLHGAPEYVRIARMRNEAGREIDYAVYGGLPTLLYLANLGAIEQHPWHSRLTSIDKPDWLALDLDPHGAPWSNVLEIALAIRDLLAERELVGFAKTSGSSGIHVYIPLEPRFTYERVARVAGEMAAEIARRLPKIATVERSLAEREPDQVYVDWLQNARGKTMAAPLSVRGKPGATVSMPIAWARIERGVKVSDFTARNAFRLVERSDPWQTFFETAQKLPPARTKKT
jgi:bifunctional non-homologous end joining protein LigD